MLRYEFNNAFYKKRRQKLKNASPKAEGILWQKLKARQFRGLKFRRQYGVGPFVIDFYCPEYRLAIEVDGDSHFGKERYDRIRQRYIEQRNIHFLRFSNDEVYQNLDGVLEAIWQWAGQKKGDK